MMPNHEPRRFYEVDSFVGWFSGPGFKWLSVSGNEMHSGDNVC